MKLPDCNEAEPVQVSGSYRAWQLASRSPAVADLAWHSCSGEGAADHHRLLPFPEPSIALRRRFSSSGKTTEWDFVVFRAQPDGGAYEPSHREELFALRLAPEMMETGLQMSPKDHLDEDCEVPRSISVLFERAARCADRDDFVGAWREMHQALLGAANDTRIDRISLAVGLARNSGGQIGPAELAALSGLSTRHLRRGFGDRLGFSPRAMLRRQRLTTAMLAAERSRKPAWAEIAVDFSFADQAHMIRECRDLMGQSPVEWHRQRTEMAVSFNT